MLIFVTADKPSVPSKRAEAVQMWVISAAGYTQLQFWQLVTVSHKQHQDQLSLTTTLHWHNVSETGNTDINLLKSISATMFGWTQMQEHVQSHVINSTEPKINTFVYSSIWERVNVLIS